MAKIFRFNKNVLIIFFLIIHIDSIAICAQDSTINSYELDHFEFLPKGLSFLPLRACNNEAKLGVLYYPNNANLKVDIGNTLDLLKFIFHNTSTLTIGIEFMAYAKSTSYKDYRLQIDAIDGFFGGNMVYTIPFTKDSVKIRFRYIHNSAHLVDGHWDFSLKKWINSRLPVPFTRDFPELVFSYYSGIEPVTYRIYSGFSNAVRVRPEIIKRFILTAGLEINTDKLIHKIFSQPANLFFAYHYQLAGLPVYQPTHQVQTGIKFGSWSGKGILFYLSYYKGNEMFNEYFADRVTKFGIGFTVDFP